VTFFDNFLSSMNVYVISCYTKRYGKIFVCFSFFFFKLFIDTVLIRSESICQSKILCHFSSVYLSVYQFFSSDICLAVVIFDIISIFVCLSKYFRSFCISDYCYLSMSFLSLYASIFCCVFRPIFLSIHTCSSDCRFVLFM